jgi:MFS family permease
MISDYFAPERRATAMSVYSMGIYIGSGIAFLLGGLVVAFASRQEAWTVPFLGETRPWQLIFFLVGLPGLIFALLLFTVREPVRRGVRSGAAVTMRETWKYLGANKRTIFCHNFGIAMLTMATYGTAAWMPTFFVRNHGWTAGQIGIWLGIIVMIFGTLGVALGGRIADKFAARGVSDANLRVALYAILLTIPFIIAYPLVNNANFALALYVPTVFLTSVPIGVAAAALQQIMPNEMRGQATALYFFIINFLGLGLGPTLIAVVTDYVFKYDNAIYLSLSIVCGATLVLSAALLAFGLKPYRRSLEIAAERSGANL